MSHTAPVTRIGQGTQPNSAVRQFTLLKGGLMRQTVADWRHIEAPVVGRLGRSP